MYAAESSEREYEGTLSARPLQKLAGKAGKKLFSDHRHSQVLHIICTGFPQPRYAVTGLVPVSRYRITISYSAPFVEATALKVRVAQALFNPTE